MLGIAFGTRPEWLKIKPVVEELERQDIPFKLIFTGQHETLLKVRNADYRLSMEPEHEKYRNRLDNIVYSTLDWTERWLPEITHLMVQGDTSSAFACALAAFHRKIPVIHLEAGLRTWDNENPFPEEANRRMISALASVNLCPTYQSEIRLRAERAPGTVHTVGNTVLDNLRNVQTTKTNTVLVTMHRRENHKDMAAWFVAVDHLARNHPELHFVLPLHPNPLVQLHRDLLKTVNVVEPMEHNDFIKALASCHSVVTDSGGIQEEAAFLRKPCVVCRKETERPEGLGTYSLLCKEPMDLNGAFQQAQKLPMDIACPYGDGNSAAKVVEILKELL